MSTFADRPELGSTSVSRTLPPASRTASFISFGCSTALPLTCVTSSPGFSPARSAGLPGSTSVIFTANSSLWNASSVTAPNRPPATPGSGLLPVLGSVGSERPVPRFTSTGTSLFVRESRMVSVRVEPDFRNALTSCSGPVVGMPFAATMTSFTSTPASAARPPASTRVTLRALRPPRRTSSAEMPSETFPGVPAGAGLVGSGASVTSRGAVGPAARGVTGTSDAFPEFTSTTMTLNGFPAAASWSSWSGEVSSAPFTPTITSPTSRPDSCAAPPLSRPFTLRTRRPCTLSASSVAPRPDAAGRDVGSSDTGGRSLGADSASALATSTHSGKVPSQPPLARGARNALTSDRSPGRLAWLWPATTRPCASIACVRCT